MDSNELKLKVKTLISNANVREALELLNDNSNMLSKPQHDQLIMLKLSFNQTKSNQISSIASIADLNRDERIIANNIISFVDQIESSNLDSNSFFNDLKPYLFVSAIVGVITAILVFLIRMIEI